MYMKEIDKIAFRHGTATKRRQPASFSDPHFTQCSFRNKTRKKGQKQRKSKVPRKDGIQLGEWIQELPQKAGGAFALKTSKAVRFVKGAVKLKSVDIVMEGR
jgi:hypothetical protein